VIVIGKVNITDRWF